MTLQSPDLPRIFSRASRCKRARRPVVPGPRPCATGQSVVLTLISLRRTRRDLGELARYGRRQSPQPGASIKGDDLRADVMHHSGVRGGLLLHRIMLRRWLCRFYARSALLIDAGMAFRF